MTESIKPLSPLRQRMIEDMKMRKLSPKTQTAYIRCVANFTRFLGGSPDTATVEDLRGYQLYLVNEGTSRPTINTTITGLRFFFEVTLDRLPPRTRPLTTLPPTVPRTTHRSLSDPPAALLRTTTESDECTDIRRYYPHPAKHRLGGLCQTSLRRPQSRPRLPLSIHPPRRHLKLPPHLT